MLPTPTERAAERRSVATSAGSRDGFHEAAGGVRDLVHRGLERIDVAARRRPEPADLAHVLHGRLADLLVGGRHAPLAQALDASAHGPMVAAGALWRGLVGLSCPNACSITSRPSSS